MRKQITKVRVEVTHYPDDGIWVAVCDEIGLTSEAESYDELVFRASVVIPELIADNGLSVSSEGCAIEFVQKQVVVG